MEKHFTHLHLHTDFSLLDGAIALDTAIDFAKNQKFKALAITDHGNIFGAVKFFQKCKKAGIKPIIGIEAYLTEDVAIKQVNNKYYHLILLVQNETGYKNLCKLISYAYQEGFYFKPRIDYNVLAQHHEGLIATTACLGGHIPRLLMQEKEQLADERIDWFLQTFGPERFYLEVQPEDQNEQKVLNEKLFDWSQRKGVGVIAAGDCHYPTREDREAHEVMLSLQTHGKLDDPNRYTFGDCRVFMRTTQEMLDEFKGHEEAIWLAGEVADKCNFEFQTDKLFFPNFPIPEQQTPESHFKQLCLKGLEKLKTEQRIDLSREQYYIDRLNIEMDLIINMGFVGYFLVVSDFIQWARRNNIPVGPGRGSAAGSLVAWALEITNIDPLRYNLLFERFLNPERVTMPDIDIDFCIEGREKVIDYVRDYYGHNKVCQIITFGTMAAKGVLKDVARVLSFPFEDSNAITSLVPDQLKITLHEAIEQEPRLKSLMESNPKVQKLFEIAFRLEGLTRHASKHAAGIVISPEPIDEVLPVYIPPRSTELVTQYAMTELETLGFLKIDFLGLKNLTLIDRAVQLIEKNHGIKLNMDMLPLDDPKAFELICAGNTSGVFQLESSGLKEVLRKLQPEKFEDIIAVNALYRPGPLGSGMVDDFIERRHGRQQITYLFDELEPVLKETYGVIVYQEQVMKIASAIAGYTLGQADILRRAMGKKKAEVMAEQKEIFLKGARTNNFDEKKAGELFDLMAYFAGYGFNKSHSAAYAMIAYQTAYLKANYPAEFMACLISLESTHAEKMAFYLQETKEMGINVLPPNINQSEIDFSIVNGNILFGLQGIKNVGLASLENIIAQRTENGAFLDLLDFCTRIDLRTTNKRVLENLNFAGAFDVLPGNRAQKHDELTRIIDQAVDIKHAKETGQMGLFGGDPTSDDTPKQYAYQPRDDWTDKEKLAKEKEIVGFYLSAHPLETYHQQLKRLRYTPMADVKKLLNSYQGEQEPIIVCCGLVKSRRDITTKKGDPMAFLKLEDETGDIEIILFPRTFNKTKQWLDEHTVFVVKGTLDLASSKPKIKANECIPLELILNEWPAIARITGILPSQITQEQIKQLRNSIKRGTSNLEFIFHENGKKLRLSAKQKITINQALIDIWEEHKVHIKLTL